MLLKNQGRAACSVAAVRFYRTTCMSLSAQALAQIDPLHNMPLGRPSPRCRPIIEQHSCPSHTVYMLPCFTIREQGNAACDTTHIDHPIGEGLKPIPKLSTATVWCGRPELNRHSCVGPAF